MFTAWHGPEQQPREAGTGNIYRRRVSQKWKGGEERLNRDIFPPQMPEKKGNDQTDLKKKKILLKAIYVRLHQARKKGHRSV